MRINGNMEIPLVVTGVKESKNDTSKDFNSVLNSQINTSKNTKNDEQASSEDSVSNEVSKQQEAINKIIKEDIKNTSKAQVEKIEVPTETTMNELKDIIIKSDISVENVENPSIANLEVPADLIETKNVELEDKKLQEVPLSEAELKEIKVPDVKVPEVKIPEVKVNTDQEVSLQSADSSEVQEITSLLDKILKGISTDKPSEDLVQKDESSIKSDDETITDLINALSYISDLLNKADNSNIKLKEGTVTNTIIKALTEKIGEAKEALTSSGSKVQPVDILNSLIETLNKASIKDSISSSDLSSILKLTDVLENKILKTNTKANVNIPAKNISEEKIDVSTDNIKAVTEATSTLDELVVKIKTEVKNILESKSDNTSKNVQVDTNVKVLIKTDVKKENLSKESNPDTEKEDKILKSILSDGEDTKIARFSLLPSKITTGNVEATTNSSTITKETFVQDLVKTVKYMNTNNLKELTVKINPKELGEVVIKIVQSEGVLKATIKAQTSETYSLLSQNANDIKKQLGDQNIRIEQVDISLNEDTSFFKGEGSEQNNLFNQDGRNRQHTSSVSQNVQGLLDIDSEDLDEAEILSNINMLA